jgi:HTH-type transcriptional regulator/antitoxin HigA
MEPTQQRQSYGRFHKSGKTGLDNRMIATWTILAQYEAGKLPAPTTKYDKTLLDKLSGELSLIFHENSNTENRVSRKLSEYGIKFCIVPKVERASIDGYSFVSNGIPSIVITRRYNRIDNLAFAVLHEIGHLKLHGNNGCGRVSVADADEQSTKEEREANEYAANILIPEDTWLNAPKVRMNPRIIQSEYSAWANRQGMNKWIVLGRVSHETGMYMFNSDKSRDIN